MSRRIDQCIKHLKDRDFEGALVDLFPAIDKTAKKRRPSKGVGERIKAFLRDEEVLISAIGTRNVFVGNSFDGVTFEDAIYKFGRTAIAHEGELDPRLTFVENGGLVIAPDRWVLPVGYISGMAASVIFAPESADERIPGAWALMVCGKAFAINEHWGKPQPIKDHICSVFRDPLLFDRSNP